MFTATLFTIARTWKQPRCASRGEWIKTLWYKNTMEYYSAIKRNKSESVELRWMNHEPVTWNEISQKEKNKYCVYLSIYMESREMVLMNHPAGQEQRCRYRDTAREGEGGMN